MSRYMACWVLLAMAAGALVMGWNAVTVFLCLAVVAVGLLGVENEERTDARRRNGR